MMCYPLSGYIIFSLRKLKFYGGWGPDVRAGAGGWITQTPVKKNLLSSTATYVSSYCLSSQKLNVNKNQCLIESGSDGNDEIDVVDTENKLIKKIEEVYANITSKKSTNLSQNVKVNYVSFQIY